MCRSRQFVSPIYRQNRGTIPSLSSSLRSKSNFSHLVPAVVAVIKPTLLLKGAGVQRTRRGTKEGLECVASFCLQLVGEVVICGVEGGGGELECDACNVDISKFR